MRTTSLFALSCALATGACMDDAPTPIPADRAGPGETLYELSRVGGFDLPAPVGAKGACTVELLGSTVVIDSAGRFRSHYRLHANCGEGRTTPEPDPGIRGRVVFRGDSAFFADSLGQSAGTGRRAGDTLFVKGRIHELVYLRAAPR